MLAPSVREVKAQLSPTSFGHDDRLSPPVRDALPTIVRAVGRTLR
jgi:hypothetical protein